MAQGSLGTALLKWILASLCLASAVICLALPDVRLGRGIRQCILLSGGVLLMAPLLQTLTQSVSRSASHQARISCRFCDLKQLFVQ